MARYGRDEDVTAKPYFLPMGYLIIKPVSPVILRPVGNGTVAGYLEGVTYLPAPTGVLVREWTPSAGDGVVGD